MRNYFPNHGAEDSTYTPWSGNILFGAAQAALSAESSTENPRTGNRSVRVEWPAPDGSGKPRVASASFGHEGIRGNWRVGGWVYVPSGSPDVAFGSVWQGLIVQNVTAKDQWVQVEVMIGSDSQIGNASWLKVETINASPNAGVVYLDDVYAYPGEGNNPEVEPDLKVEISWDGLPFDENPTWDDITDYVQAVNPSYGRSSEIGSVEAGTCELVLDNEDGRFTPKRAASPYFPNIRPRRPVRVTAEWDGAIWPLFRGHVDRWPASTASGYTNVSVALVDIFGVLSKKTLENIYVHYLRNNSLRELYAFNDGPDSFAATVDPTKAARVVTPSGSTVAEGTLGDSPSVSANGTDILPNGAGTGAVSVSGVAYNAGGSTDTQLTGRMIEFPTMEFDNTASSLGWTISFWHAFDGLPAMGGDENVGQCMALRLENSSGGLIATILYNAHPTGKGYTVYWPEGGSIDLHYDPAADLATHYMGQGNHVVLSFSNDCRHDGSNVPGLALFVNGAGSYREIPASAWIGVKHSARMLFGANPSVKPEAIGSNTIMAHNFRLEMFSVHDRDTDWWNNALMMERASGNPGQSAHDRAKGLLDQMNWPGGLRHFDRYTTESRMRFLNWESNPNALDEIRAPALDTNGLLFVNPAGQITFQSRRLRQNPSPHFIFDHEDGTGVESPLEFDMSEQDMVNVVNVDNAYGIKAQVRNDNSVAVYDELTKSADLRLESDAEALQYGYWQVNRFGEPQLRVDAVQINPSAHATGGLWGHVLGMALSTVVGLRGIPNDAPDAAADYFVESVTHAIERNGERLHWTTTLRVSPATDREAWVLGDSTYGVLGSTTRLHY